MKKSDGKWGGYALLVALGFSIILWGCGPGAPKTLSSTEGKFTVTLPPGYPAAEMSTQNVPTAVGDVSLVMYMSEKPEGACMIGFADFPDSVVNEGSDVETLLDGGRDGALRNINGTLEKEEPYAVQGNRGRKIYFSGKSQNTAIHGQAIFCLVKNRVYQIVYMNLNKETLTKPEIQAFFSSFKITNVSQK